MKVVCLKIFKVVLGAVFVVSSAMSVYSQEMADNEFYLEEVTVTAQKREENNQKVPVAMEVVTNEDIHKSGKNDLEEILNNIPGIVFSKDEDGLRISLRGMSDDTDSYQGQSASMPTVAINVDGVYSSRKDNASGLFDLERVEVLYGPQSTMYASNSPGGIVNVVTANPKLDVYEGSGTLEVGNYNLLHTEGVMNAPVGDTIALRAAFSSSSHDGYLSNGGDDEDSKAARLRMLYEPNEKFSFTVTGEMNKSSSYTSSTVSEFDDSDDLDDPWETDEELSSPNEKKNEKLYGSMDFDLGFGILTFIPSYSEGESSAYDQDATAGDTETFMDNEGKSGELRLNSSAESAFTWILGLNYYDSTDIMNQTTYEDGVANGEYMYSYVNEEAKAIFGNITYPVTDKFRVNAGLRYSEDSIKVVRDEARAKNGSFDYDAVNYDCDYSSPDYKLGVEYDVAESSMIYASYTTSYRVQGFSSTSRNAAYEEPPAEELNAYTLGAKNRFFNNKLQVNASAYYYDYSNYFVTESATGYYGFGYEDSPTSDYCDDDPDYSTWGAGHMMGVDIAATAVITSKDIVNLSVAYLKSEWTDMVIDYYYEYFTDTEIPPGNTDTLPVEVYAMDYVDYSGKSMNHSPEWTVAGSYKHIFDLWNGGVLETQIDATYKGDYRLSWKDSNYPYNYQEAFTKIDLSCNYQHSDGKWNLSAYVRNLTNYAEKTGYTTRGDTRIGSPRTYGAVLSIKF